MSQSTARQLQQQQPQEYQSFSPDRQLEKSPYLKKEVKAFVYSVVWLAVLGLLLVHSSTKLARAEQALTKVNHQLTEVKKSNNTAKQEISELTSQSRLNKVATQNDLSLHEKNIRSIVK